MAFCDPMWPEVNVLLVDQDPVCLVEAAKLLQLNSYRVTAVQDASVASSMLSKEDTQFDLVMVDVSASNLQGFRLLYDAVNVEVTVILMSANATPSLIKCAIEDGAFLFIQKPATVDLLKYLWQYVFREKTRKYRENLRCREFITENQDNINEDTTENQNQARIIRTSRNGDTDKRVRGKTCTEWTLKLHQKFIDAVRELGEGRCYPREILQLMNVPGLKRMQVASHLQRCRAGWQHPEERDSTAPSKASNQSNNSCRPRTYGLFPYMIGGPQDPLLEANEHVSYTMNNPTPSPGMGQHGTVSINNDINESSDQNFHGNMAAANQELPLPDSSFDFANEDLTDNFCMQDFQLDDSLSAGQVITRDNEEAGGFWSAWVSSFAGDL